MVERAGRAAFAGTSPHLLFTQPTVPLSFYKILASPPAWAFPPEELLAAVFEETHPRRRHVAAYLAGDDFPAVPRESGGLRGKAWDGSGCRASMALAWRLPPVGLQDGLAIGAPHSRPVGSPAAVGEQGPAKWPLAEDMKPFQG